jgi:hypothetical protein
MTTERILTRQYQTIATVGYTAPVSRDENRAAHGGVCHIQGRRLPGGVVAFRKVNSNGQAEEVGKSWNPDSDEIEHWLSIGRSQN